MNGLEKPNKLNANLNKDGFQFSNIKNVKLNVHWIFYYHDLLIFHGTSGYDEKERKKQWLSVK